MSNNFDEMLHRALKLDYQDAVKELFSLRSGFFVKVGDEYGKVSGGCDYTVEDGVVSVTKLPFEYSVDQKTFDKLKIVAQGINCSINNLGNLHYKDESQNFIYEIRTPNEKNISNILAIASGNNLVPVSPSHSTKHQLK